jgi:hypothetical protein
MTYVTRNERKSWSWVVLCSATRPYYHQLQKFGLTHLHNHHQWKRLPCRYLLFTNFHTSHRADKGGPLMRSSFGNDAQPTQGRSPPFGLGSSKEWVILIFTKVDGRRIV